MLEKTANLVKTDKVCCGREGQTVTPDHFKQMLCDKLIGLTNGLPNPAFCLQISLKFLETADT